MAPLLFRQRKSSPEGPARHLDASRQKLTPHCLAAIFDSQLPSPKLSLKIPPKLPLPHNRGHFFFFQNCPRGEGNCAAIERQKLSRGNFCLAASICLSRPSGSALEQGGVCFLFPSSKEERQQANAHAWHLGEDFPLDFEVQHARGAIVGLLLVDTSPP